MMIIYHISKPDQR